MNFFFFLPISFPLLIHIQERQMVTLWNLKLFPGIVRILFPTFRSIENGRNWQHGHYNLKHQQSSFLKIWYLKCFKNVCKKKTIVSWPHGQLLNLNTISGQSSKNSDLWHSDIKINRGQPFMMYYIPMICWQRSILIIAGWSLMIKVNTLANC